MHEPHPHRLGSQEQFGRQARFYSESLVHSSGESLQVVQEWASRGRYERAVDIGTGTGFTAFAVAPYVRHILASDITPAMLEEARRLADQRGVDNLGCTLAAAEDLPFADASLDLVTCRTAAHHFRDLRRAVAQWPRVLAPEGVLILADTTAPEDRETARWMNEMEARRDPSHVRDLPPSEWLSLLEASGFSITDTALAPVPLEFDDWVRRSGTPEPVVQRLRRDFLSAPGGARDAFQIHQDEFGSVLFRWQCLVVRALRRG
ncbi:MAG: methyltransferase domain-containing protein [Chloroflexi bacterium]|nr:methyltransferase domain-containing protein [Chloroflexota bacterium]